MNKVKRLAAIQITGGRNYRARFEVSGCPVQVEFQRIDNFLQHCEQLRAEGVRSVDGMLKQVNPLAAVYYSFFEVEGRKIYQVANELQDMLQRLQRSMEYLIAAAPVQIQAS
ncbi:hypothetical protein [Paenibacillus shenyangensis]|uniref:hypothetical protein n=1 Tax=Paenibacillus sp. A9 TaxID=1284352 RepID=UPI000368CA55|nr:hypothetical protein [Paenibacillus sp. A9]